MEILNSKTMNKIKIVLTAGILLFTLCANAQDRNLSSLQGKSSLGIGVGLPYGGIGARFGTNLVNGLNLFGGVGYQISGIGFNAGLRQDVELGGLTQMYFTGMYGTNAAIKVSGLPEYDKLYMGATLGMGLKFNSRSKEGNYWDAGLVIPLRSSQYKTDETKMQNDPRIASFTSPWPVLIVVGYNFNL